MTKKKLLLIGGIVVLCLVICLCVVMCSPAEQGGEVTAEPTGTTGSSTMTYTIQVGAETGTPLEEIGVYIYTDSTMSELVWFAKTDAEGKLSFSDIASDNFVAVLADVPAGYLVEEYYPLTGEMTEIKLSAGLMEGDLSTITYKLGDLMLDFSVTGPDGTVYQFSELLKEKDAIILNFWYLQCEPCKSEFPYLQQAYEQYSDKVAVLAMNPVNQNNDEIEQFRKDNGYTFPMMACDPNWEKAMQLTAYPTTVVIDRFGYITLVHRGTITEAETFEAVMDYFSAEDYEHTIFKNIEDLEDAAGVVQTVGTADNPVQMGATYSFQVTVEPGQEMHYEIYRMVSLRYLSLINPNAYLIYKNVTYTGSIYLPVVAEDTNSPVKLIFGNSGTETQTYTVYLSIPQGSPDNPYTLTLDADNKLEFDVNVPAGNDQGICYRYPTNAEGIFTVELISATPGVDFDVTVETIKPPDIPVQRNLNSDSTVNAETGNKTVSVNAYKNSKITIKVGSTSTDHPAVSVKLLATFKEGAIEDTTVKKVTYSVNVTDENRKPVPGIMLDMMVGEEKVTITTDEKGVASTKQVPGTYTLTMREPNGYIARNLTYKLTEKNPSISIRLETLVTEEYTVKVVDTEGKPLKEAFVTIGNTFLETDDTGTVVFNLVDGSYTAKVAAAGYYSKEEAFPAGSRELTVQLEADPEASFIEYTVNVKDYYGSAVSGVGVTFYQNGAASASATTGADGNAVKKLLPGDYTVGINGNYYIVSGNTALTEAEPATGLSVVTGVSGESEILYVGSSQYNSYFVESGATYLKLDSGTNYIQFTPGAASGLYQVTTLDPNDIVSYWGNPFYVHHVTEFSGDITYDSASNVLQINHKDSHGYNTYVLGVTGGGDSAVLLITRVGDFIKDENDLEFIDYTPEKQPTTQNITIPSGKKLTYVDVVNGSAAEYTLFVDSNGNYHFDSVTGPQVYIHLGASNKIYKPPYLCLSDMIGVTDSYAANPFYYIVRDAAGNGLYKENYAPLLIQYCECTKDSAVGLYLLTKDLIHMLQYGGDNKGWYDYDNVNYIFKDGNGNKIAINEELAWMFALCYFE